MKKRFLLIAGLFLLVLAGFCLASTCTSSSYCQTQYNSTSYYCISNECQKYTSNSTSSNTTLSNYKTYFCSNASACTKFGPKYTCVNYQCKKTKILRTNTTTPSAGYLTVIEQVKALDQKLTGFNKTLSLNTQNIQKINLNVQKLGSDVSSLKTGATSLKNSLSQNSQTVNSVSTGLASLQKNVQSTDTKVSNITSKLETVEKSRPLTKTVLFILIAIFVFAGVLVFVLYKRGHAPELPLELMKYIHQNMTNRVRNNKKRAASVILTTLYSILNLRHNYRVLRFRNQPTTPAPKIPSRIAPGAGITEIVEIAPTASISAPTVIPPVPPSPATSVRRI